MSFNAAAGNLQRRIPPHITMIRERRALVNEASSVSSASGDERVLRLETALRRSEKVAMAGRLAAAVMHEINNPSQANADLVYLIGKEANQPDRVRAHAAQVEEQLTRIQYIARQTLSFFRDSQHAQPKDLVSLVDAALRYHARFIDEKQIRVRKEMPDVLIAPVFPGDFLQLVSNLVRNSAEALPVRGSLRVRLRALGAQARLTIADSGRGIPAAIQNHLFEAFQTDKAEAGNGLGLWICKTIVEKHGGRIQWHSATGGEAHGTVFTVIMPLADLPPAGSLRTHQA